MEITNNEYVAHHIMGMQPCGGWIYVNFGSAGGAALQKECQHADGTCYPVQTLKSMHGNIGGVPTYDSDWRFTKGLIEKLRSEEIAITIRFDREVVHVRTTKGSEAVEVAAATECEAVTAAAVFLWMKIASLPTPTT